MVRKVIFWVLCLFHGHVVLAEGGRRVGGRTGVPGCAASRAQVVTRASAPCDIFTGTGMLPPFLHSPSDRRRGACAWVSSVS